VGWWCCRPLDQGLKLLLNLCESGTELRLNSLELFSVQIILTSDFSSKLDEFLNQVKVVWVLAVCQGVVGSHRFMLRYWLAPEVLLPL
jgi:hypothetical protein